MNSTDTSSPNVLTDHEKALAKVFADPVLFAKVFLNWHARWYQAEMLRGSLKYKRIVCRCGRRTGKTNTMAVHMLWYAYTHKNATCLVVAPMEEHIKMLFKTIREFIDQSSEISSSIKSNTRNPHYIEFLNGSVIKGLTAGTKSGSKALASRGQTADWIYFDEMDYLSDDDVDSTFAITTERSGIGVWGASTPTGRRGKFFSWCELAHGKGKVSVPPGVYSGETWTEFYFPGTCNPNWSDEMERELRIEYPGEKYLHEVMAEFGEEIVGVFNKADIEAAQEDYEYVTAPRYETVRIVGVDWDKYGAGTNIVVIAYDFVRRKFFIETRVEIGRSKRTLSHAVDTIVEIDRVFKPTHIYIDRGYGEFQLESLTEKLGKKVKGLQSSEKIEVVDPYTRLPDKKPAKPFMVTNLQIIMERQKLAIPRGDIVLVKQFHDYRVIKVSTNGQPIFSDENEHILDAIMLALLGFTLEHPNITKIVKRPEYASTIAVIDKPLFTQEDMSSRTEEIEVVKKRYSGAPTWGPRGSTSNRRHIYRRRKL